jgi:TPR repeat protein
MYASGKGVPQDNEKAIELWAKITFDNSPFLQFMSVEEVRAAAQYKLGSMMKVWWKVLRRIIRKRSNGTVWPPRGGHIDAQFILGSIYLNGRPGVPKNGWKAGQYYTMAAEQGHIFAANDIGCMYFDGDGVPQNYQEAVKWFTKAAEQGCIRNQFFLGFMYHIGDGVPQDYKEAVKWYTLAANRGYAAAQCNLGVMYAEAPINWDFTNTKDKGITRDTVKAYMWFNLAAAQGHKNSKENRDILMQKMSSDQITEAQRLSREFIETIENGKMESSPFYKHLQSQFKL